jgi:hypothetical protein
MKKGEKCKLSNLIFENKIIRKISRYAGKEINWEKRTGEVISVSERQVRVLWNGNKAPETYSRNYIEAI